MSTKKALEHALLPTTRSTVSRTRRSIRWTLLAFTVLLGVSVHVRCTRSRSSQHNIGPLPPTQNSSVCPQVGPLLSRTHVDLDAELDTLYATTEFKLNAYEAHGGAIRIPTESYDGFGEIGVDPRWEVFEQLHEYLLMTFPLIHSTLQLTKVNTYALAYHWQGSDATLKPLLLTAHQDVVPVNPATVDEWIHPPYSGYYDGTWIWGRGSGDDKSGLISMMVAIEALLEKDFQPSRSVVLAFGIDEESAGKQGAGQLAIFLEKAYGINGFALLVDEGGGYTKSGFGGDVIFALPSTAEKGYLDVQLEVSTDGGHSSVPPPHTSIGILSDLIVHLERRPHPPELLRSGVNFASTLCAAAYAPSFPDSIRALALRAVEDDDALLALKHALIALSPIYGAMLSTTQAVDIVNGGVKINALPEKATAVVNHRIGEHSSLAELRAELVSVLEPVALQYGLSVDAFGHNHSLASSAGVLRLSDAYESGLEVAPKTPTHDSAPWALLSGTIKATLTTSKGYNSSGVVVSPFLSLGNTDTQFYWNLTHHIFRYSHLSEADLFNGEHTVNEAIRAEAIIEGVRFFTKLILNADEAFDI